ncbi:MAG: hypothetical protein AAFR67_03715 [Chloroflexota bacterium]
MTDAQGQSVDVVLTVRNQSRLPDVAGIYDDSSFAFDYSDGWTTRGQADAINNTIHISTTAGSTAEFGMRGTGFVLYMYKSFGGLWDLEIDMDSGSTSNFQTLTNWTLVPGSTRVYRAFIDNPVDDTVFTCSTNAINTFAVPVHLKTEFPIGANYTVTCNSYNYNDGGNGIFDWADTLTSENDGVHLAKIINTSGLQLIVDAFSLVNDDDTAGDNQVPLGPGFHEVTELVLRDAFGSNWTEFPDFLSSNGLAYRLTGATDTDTSDTDIDVAASANNVVSFLVTGGAGVAIETAIAPQPAEFTMCVTNVTSGNDEMTCQRFNYQLSQFLFIPLAKNTYRPFHGLNPDDTYRVDVIPTRVVNSFYPMVIDGVRVFAPIDVPLEPLSGVVDDSDQTRIYYGGGIEDTWTFNANTFNAINRTLTDVNFIARAPGPYVAFTVPSNIDTIYWTHGEVAPSQHVMICADRADGVGTSTTAVEDLTDVNSAHGNCLLVNTSTGDYVAIGQDGSVSPTPDGNIRVVSKTIAISESDFSAAWADDADGVIIEIFTLYENNISVDTLSAIGATAPLTEGRYEEYVTTFDYFELVGGNYQTTVPEVVGSTSTFSFSPSAIFTQAFSSFTPDFGGGVLYTDDIGATIGFEFTGRGFAPAFRLQSSADQVTLCWITDGELAVANAITDVEKVTEAFANGDCQAFDNHLFGIRYNAHRPILGLPEDTYYVGIRFDGDNFTPSIISIIAGIIHHWCEGGEICIDDFYTIEPHFFFQ